MQAYLTPIQRTLLELLRRPDSTQTPSTPVSLTAADWEALLAEAGRQEVIPLLHYRLKSRPELKGRIPAPILERIKTLS